MAVSLLASTASVADGQADRDSKEVSNYVLTEAALAKYTRAAENLGRLGKTLPGACDDSEGAKSLADAAARLDAIPQAKAAILSPGIQMANVKFLRAHDAALKKLGQETKSDDCEDDDRANESEQ